MVEPAGFIGFANIADQVSCHYSSSEKKLLGYRLFPQVHRKSVKRGFEFTLMVVGESGLGKSTMVNSLFLADLYSDRKLPTADERVGLKKDFNLMTIFELVYVINY